MDNIKKVKYNVFGFIGGVIICALISLFVPEKSKIMHDIQRDTITISDTIIHPQYYKTMVVRKDTVLLPVIKEGDSRIDTVRVEVPIERKIYADSSYYAVVSGYNPSLDSIIVRNKYITETKTKTEYVKEKKRWGIGLQAGYGISSQGQCPYVGVGISYNIIRW